MRRMRHFRLVLDAAQKLLGEASGARLDEAEKLLSPLHKLAHRDEHKAKVRKPCSPLRPPSCALLTATSFALLGLARPGSLHAGALQHQCGEVLRVSAPRCNSECVRRPSR